LLHAAAGIPKVFVRGELDRRPGMRVTYRETEWYLYLRNYGCGWVVVVVKKTLVCVCGFWRWGSYEGRSDWLFR
jgi:hypothetical protein